MTNFLPYLDLLTGRDTDKPLSDNTIVTVCVSAMPSFSFQSNSNMVIQNWYRTAILTDPFSTLFDKKVCVSTHICIQTKKEVQIMACERYHRLLNELVINGIKWQTLQHFSLVWLGTQFNNFKSFHNTMFSTISLFCQNVLFHAFLLIYEGTC